MYIPLTFIPNGPVDNQPTLIHVIARRRTDDKPLSEPIVACLLTRRIWITRPQYFFEEPVMYYASFLLHANITVQGQDVTSRKRKLRVLSWFLVSIRFLDRLVNNLLPLPLESLCLKSVHLHLGLQWLPKIWWHTYPVRLLLVLPHVWIVSARRKHYSRSCNFDGEPSRLPPLKVLIISSRR